MRDADGYRFEGASRRKRGGTHARTEHRICAARMRIVTFHDTSQGPARPRMTKHDIS